MTQTLIIVLLSCHGMDGLTVHTAVPDSTDSFQAVEMPDAPENTRALSKVPAHELNELLNDLCNPEFQKRLDATAQLESMGTEILEALARHCQTNRDLETRLRIHGIAKHIIYKEAAQSRGGFLGISYELNWTSDREEIDSVIVRSVIPGSGAGQAGLKPGDVITKVNDQTVELTERDSFSAAVTQWAPGTVLQLTVLRDKEEIKKTVTLTTRPMYLLEQSTDPADEEVLDNIERQYAKWLATTSQN